MTWNLIICVNNHDPMIYLNDDEPSDDPGWYIRYLWREGHLQLGELPRKFYVVRKFMETIFIVCSWEAG